MTRLVERYRFPGMWFFGVERNPCRFGTDAVTLESVPFLLEGFGCTFPPLLGAYQGDPRTSSGSSVIVVAFLLGGVVWYAMIQSASIVVGICRRGRSS